MIFKSIMLGFLIFLVDAVFYGIYIASSEESAEKREFIAKLKFIVPIGIFMQTFFALIFVFTFRFLAIFKALDVNTLGGLYFSYILFLPMLYMLFNNWLWLNSKRSTTYLNIMAWGIKLAICGLVTPLI